MHVGPGYNWDWCPSSRGYTISGCNQPTRSTQSCIPPGSLNRVPASAGVTAGMSPLLYSVYFTFYLLYCTCTTMARQSQMLKQNSSEFHNTGSFLTRLFKNSFVGTVYRRFTLSAGLYGRTLYMLACGSAGKG